MVIVTRLDRLARSTRDLLNILDRISKAGAQFKSLRETWADTTSPAGRLMITVIGGIAEFDHALNYFLLGCGTVQVCPAAMLDHAIGPNVICISAGRPRALTMSPISSRRVTSNGRVHGDIVTP